jgi:predicted Zn-dependent protease
MLFKTKNNLQTASIFNIMKNIIYSLIIASLFSSCALDLATGRNELSPAQEKGLQHVASTQYTKYLKDSKVLNPNTNLDAAMVERVGTRITNAITKYYNKLGKGAMLNGYKWEFNTVDSKDINAWCMPGGKVIVYTGLLKVTQNETALAIVMGHEIAHAIAKHCNDGMDQAIINKLEGPELENVLALMPTVDQDHLHMSFVTGSKDVVLSQWTRHQESEADKFGLEFAAIAGYDPREAFPFLQRMSSARAASQPESLSMKSTHNSRLKNLKQFMPGALNFYTPSIDISAEIVKTN